MAKGEPIRAFLFLWNLRITSARRSTYSKSSISKCEQPNSTNVPPRVKSARQAFVRGKALHSDCKGFVKRLELII